MYIVFLGAPGSGKGTSAKMLAKEMKLPHISTGDMFRAQIKKQTELGKKANEYISKGNLVPDELTIQIVKDRLECEDAIDGAILDGFPRTINQVKELEKFLESRNQEINLVPELLIPDDIIIDRIVNRQTCSNKDCGAIYNKKYIQPKIPGICDVCGSELVSRTDDTEETIKERLKTYYNNSKELVEYYSSKKVLYPIIPTEPASENASEEAVQKILNYMIRKRCRR